MTLEALASSPLPAFVVYDTISASSLCDIHDASIFDRAGLGSVALSGFGQDYPKPVNGESSVSGQARRKRRRRLRSCKNKEEAETQRMTHIAVERNRRCLMNDHLAVLRSLMPDSYIQRGDQASVVGGAIDFVKELEQHLQYLEVQKRRIQLQKIRSNSHEPTTSPPPFAHFFAYPQYTWCHTPSDNQPAAAAAADIEVSVIETHANLRILTPRRPRQLLKLVAGLHSLRLNTLHLNVTTLDSTALYSVSVKIEEGCNLTTVDDIAAAVHHMVTLFQAEEATTSLV